MLIFAYYQQTITLDPASIDAYTQAGVALFLGGQMEEATEPWGQGLKVQRELAHSHELDQLGIRFCLDSARHTILADPASLRTAFRTLRQRSAGDGVCVCIQQFGASSARRPVPPVCE